MQLTKQTDYAFRTLLYLATLEPGEKAQIKQICDYYDISSNHLAKIVLRLSRLGFIHSHRGKNGGLELAQKPEAINLGDIVRTFESGMNPVNCEQPSCTIAADCLLKGVLVDAMQAFTNHVSKFTLADIALKRSSFEALEIVKIV